MTINYMDYATWDCYNAFTQGQSSRMEFFLLNVRQSLLQSEGCKDPCLNPVTASFTVPAGSTLPAGSNVLFTNTSTNGVGYEWTVNGTVVGTSSNLNYTFINEGMQVVLLRVAGSDPNCTDFTADTFFVVCPIQASFILDNPSPAPGDVVTGISTGSGASQYEWTMNGVPFGNASTASVTIPGPGYYSICMTASDAYCVRTVCEGISLEDTSACDDNLFRLVFTPASMSDFVPLPNGSYLAGGSYWADSLYLMHLTPDGEVSSSRSFNVFPGEDEYILDLEVVSGGYVIGIGSTVHYAPVSEWKCFAFKYDYQNQNFVWLRTFGQANFHFDIFRSDIKELPGSGNYLVNSQNRSSYARSTQLILDKTTGDVVSGKDFGEINTTIGLKKMIRAGQQFFTVGYRIGSTPHPGTLLSAWDNAGQLLWSKEYAAPQTNMYAFQMAHLNNHLYLLSDGADTNRYFVVTKTDLYGQPVWSRRVDLPYNTLLTNGKTITPVGDGLVVHLNDVTADRSWFYKFNEEGQLVWTRTMEMPTKFVINDIQAEGNDLWLVGFQSITAGRSVLLRINPEKSFGGTCKLYAETTATAYDFPVTVNDRSLLTSDLNYTEQSPNVLLRPVPFILQDWCPVVTCPEICDNGLDDDSDGYVDCFDVNDCPCDDLPECISIGVVPTADHRIAGKLDWASPGGMAYIGWTPIVGNLNPKQDNMPEIIAGKYANNLSADELLIFRGDGSDAATPQKLIIPQRLSAFHPATPAIGDLNGDSIPELVVICADHRMRVYTNYQPGANPVMTLMAVSVDTTILVPSSKPLLADFDADGISEIYLGNEVFRFDFSTPGNLVLRRTAPAVTVPNGRETHDDRTSCSIAADLLKPIDCAGDPD
ncbi:MAG TPA: hypothetical protein PK228_20570, partial [Saprospiraceae bacterium]|nr:hypothetical protein [Saprospiraceae bacterium]